MDLNSPAVRAWAAAAPPLIDATAVGSDVVRPRRRILASSRTRHGWFIAASPLILMMTITGLAALAGGLSWAELLLVVVMVAGANFLAVRRDLDELDRRGFNHGLSQRAIWTTPFVYLVRRARGTRDDFYSYRLVWANAAFTIGAVAFVVAAILAATWISGLTGILGSNPW